jgi:hypothetical protein
MRYMRKTIHLAQKMGKSVGRSALLLGALQAFPQFKIYE